MVLFQSNFLRMRRNIAAYNTLYTYSSLSSIFSDTPSRPAGPRHHRGRRAKPFGRSGGLWPPGKFLKIGFKIVLFQSNFQHFRRNIAAYNTLYTNSSLLFIFSDTPSRSAGPRHHRGRRAEPFGGPRVRAIWGVRGALAPRKNF